MSEKNIDIPQEKLAEFCKRNQIRKLSLFGSVLRNDFHAKSDVDMLVEFEPGTRVSLFDLVRLEDDLTEIIGRKVDLRTQAELSRYFRQRVVESAEVQYVHR